MLKLLKRFMGGSASAKPIYKPEPDYSTEFPHSGWRKPLDVNAVNPKARRSMLGLEFSSLKFLDIINVFLCILVLLGIVKLVFFTTYEQTVLVDGTELSCLLMEDGQVVPYTPPVAPSVPMPKTPLLQEKPMEAPYNQGRAAELGTKPIPQLNPNSGVVALSAPSAQPPANTIDMTSLTPTVPSMGAPGAANSSTGISSKSMVPTTQQPAVSSTISTNNSQ